jgi:hypothetical protein
MTWTTEHFCGSWYGEFILARMAPARPGKGPASEAAGLELEIRS